MYKNKLKSEKQKIIIFDRIWYILHFVSDQNEFVIGGGGVVQGGYCFDLKDLCPWCMQHKSNRYNNIFR